MEEGPSLLSDTRLTPRLGDFAQWPSEDEGWGVPFIAYCYVGRDLRYTWPGIRIHPSALQLNEDPHLGFCATWNGFRIFISAIASLAIRTEYGAKGVHQSAPVEFEYLANWEMRTTRSECSSLLSTPYSDIKYLPTLLNREDWRAMRGTIRDMKRLFRDDGRDEYVWESLAFYIYVRIEDILEP
jgi:hypothetical protein